MASVEANGITIEYEESGSGDPLLLVMGLNGQLIDWPAGLIDALVDEGFRVIRFDNRDAGLSTEFSGPPPTTRQMLRRVVFRTRVQPEYTLSDMARDAVGLLDALGIERAHVAGMSMGGMIAQLIAIEHPSRVLSLTSIMSNTGSRWIGLPTAKVLAYVARRKPVPAELAIEPAVELFRLISGSTFDDAEFREMAKASIVRSYRPAGTARQLAAILAAKDRTPRLRELDVPTLVIHGTLDSLVRPNGGIATAKAVPGARLLMFNDMGHDLPHTRWHEIASAIRANADRGQEASAVTASTYG
jgi:pimeloyl-ACP methyl ester carboxylesterase